MLAIRFIAEKAKEKQIEAGGALRQKSDKAEIDTKKELARARHRQPSRRPSPLPIVQPLHVKAAVRLSAGRLPLGV
jgi:hypothetical protein